MDFMTHVIKTLSFSDFEVRLLIYHILQIYTTNYPHSDDLLLCFATLLKVVHCKTLHLSFLKNRKSKAQMDSEEPSPPKH